MKANELMVGDWLQYHDCNLEKQCYAQVTSIRADGTEPYIQTSDSDVYYLAETYKPIPLTPEILEKNWFVKQEDGYFRYFKPYDENYYIGFESISYFFDGKTAKIIKEHSQSGLQEKVEFTCEYLHELQHALKLCGITLNIEV